MRFFPNRRLILVLLGLVWLELSLLPFFSVWGVKPDLFFVFLVFYAFRINWKRVIGLALILGLAKDFLTHSFFGLEAASHTAGAVLLQFLAVRFDRDKRWVQLAGLFSFSWFTLMVYSVMAWIVQAPYQFGSDMAKKSFLIATYTTLAGLVLFDVLERWLKPTLRDKQYELF